jgi:homoserine kinase
VGLILKSMKLRLPATSANLGAAFDCAAVALGFGLEIEAEEAEEFSIAATGRNADLCSQLVDNLILATYRNLLVREGRAVQPLAIRMHNEIPLGMGCGSSAACRLAAIALASHFGGLAWDDNRILSEATELEGHPDNAAACWLGGLAIAACAAGSVHVARVAPPAGWSAMLVFPRHPVATSEARAVLPDEYSRSDVVANLQAASMLGLAFAQGRGDLLLVAMADRIHQPYRSKICPLLPRLLPLGGSHGILGVALSGAGPSVLLILSGEAAASPGAREAVLEAIEHEFEAEILLTCFAQAGGNGYQS